MWEELKTIMEEAYIPNLITIIGILLTIVTILIGFYTLYITFKNSLALARKANMIEKSAELPKITQEFIRSASLALGYNIRSNFTDSKEDKQLFKKYNQKQSKLLEELSSLMISYGSETSISVFNDFYSLLKKYLSEEERTSDCPELIKMYYSLPLLMSLVKYDMTGEIINPQLMCELLMPEFRTLNPPVMGDMINKSNKLVNMYRISKKFIWKEKKAHKVKARR